MTVLQYWSDQVWESEFPYQPWLDSTNVSSNKYFEASEEIKVLPPKGTFTPGVFRILPYSVMRRSFTGTSTTMVSTESVGTSTECTRRYTGKHLCNSTTWAMCATGVLSTLETKRMLALQRAYAKVGQPALQLGTEFGELRETIQMLRSPLRSLRDFLEHPDNFKKLQRLDTLRRYRRNFGLPPAKAAADSWLEFRYGIRPLINSVKEIAEYAMAAREKLLASKRIFTLRSRWSSTENAKKDFKSNINYVPVKGTYSYEDDLRVEAIVYYNLLFEQSMASKLGLSPANIPEILWELTRLSFVCDWLFSVGPWLESFRLTPNMKILGSTTSQRISRKGSFRGDGTMAYVKVSNAGQATYEQESFQRFVHTSQPLTPLFRGSDGLDLLKAIDASALILQPLLKKLSRR